MVEKIKASQLHVFVYPHGIIHPDVMSFLALRLNQYGQCPSDVREEHIQDLYNRATLIEHLPTRIDAVYRQRIVEITSDPNAHLVIVKGSILSGKEEKRIENPGTISEWGSQLQPKLIAFAREQLGSRLMVVDTHTKQIDAEIASSFHVETPVSILGEGIRRYSTPTPRANSLASKSPEELSALRKAHGVDLLKIRKPFSSLSFADSLRVKGFKRVNILNPEEWMHEHARR